MKAPLFLTPLFNLFGHATQQHRRRGCQRRWCEPSVARTADRGHGHDLRRPEGTVNLDFQTGTAATAAWETYEIDNASTTQVRDLWKKLPFCAGQPKVDAGYCGNVSNGVNETIVNEILQPMFKANPTRCYLIPVVREVAT